MNVNVTYEVWGQCVTPYHDRPFLRYSGEDERKAQEEYERLVRAFPHIGFSLVKVTRETLEQYTSEGT